jgi:hypothetical protein
MSRRVLTSVVPVFSALVVLSSFAMSTAIPRLAHAADCDAGCADEDDDGFVACGCALSGTPCDCDDADPSTFPGAPEACDANKDLSCSGVAGDPCPTKRGCLGSVCVPECIPLDDFGCAPGTSFAPQPNGTCLCAPPDCTYFGCPPGSTCSDDKTCVPSCGPEVRCPSGERCRGGACVDPCADVLCPAGSACRDGACVASCDCCPAGEACDSTSGSPRCVETACIGVRCATGAHCEGGACVEDCAGVVCPPRRVCRPVSVNGRPPRGSCVDLCLPDPCKPGFACDWRSGACNALPIADDGLVAPDAIEEALEVGGAGWLCNGAGLARVTLLTGLSGLGAVLALLARRRRRT